MLLVIFLYENDFPHKLLLSNVQVSRLRKAFANNSLANIKLNCMKKDNQEDLYVDFLNYC